MFPLKDNVPTDRFPLVTVAIIAANVLMYFVFQKAGLLSGPDDGVVIDYGAIPYEITHPGQNCELAGEQLACEGQPGVTGSADPQPATALTLFTSMFMHGSLLHIAGNMLFLWIFGNNVEDSMGRLKFLLFYLAGGLAAIALQTAVGPDAAVPTVGASGAVAAVLGAYVILHPRARVLTLIFLVIFFTFVELPAMLVLGAWFLLQIFSGLQDFAAPATGGGGGVAYFAHIGGFIFGLVLIAFLASNRKATPPRSPVY